VTDQKPGQSLIFLPTAQTPVLAEALVALANADGGTIVLGLHEDGTPAATPLWEEEAEGALRAAQLLCKPPVMTEWQAVQLVSGTQIGLRVLRSPDLHTLTDGRVLVRHGTENRPVSGREIVHLAGSRTASDFESEAVPGAHRDDLDPLIIEEYLAKRETRGAARVGSLERLLFEVGAIDLEGKPTVAGMLLFGRNPQAFLPQSGIVFVRFPGTRPANVDGGIGYGRRDEISGPLARIVERAWNVIWEEMRVGAQVRGLERQEVTEYPPFAVREALVNAICHRDYRLRGRRIEIRMYSDRLEIISPGGLAGYMTLDNLVEEHYSRNPRIVNGLYYWGYIEELGLGIDRMIEDMEAAGHPRPTFNSTGWSFTVVLARSRTAPASVGAAWSAPDRQRRAVRYVQENGSITNREYQQVCEGVSAETLRRDLADLVQQGIFLKIGSKKGTSYILK
jgi:ATP-dependent DNA helicase RecG